MRNSYAPRDGIIFSGRQAEATDARQCARGRLGELRSFQAANSSG
jgi:hypothetical protein